MGISNRMVPRQHYAATYDTETVHRLCRIAHIDPGHSARVRDELERCAAIYRWRHAAATSRKPGTPIKRELNKLSKQAARLMETLAALSPDAARAIERQIDADAQSCIVNADTATDKQSLFIQLDDPGSDTIGHSADLDMLKAIVARLCRAAETEAAAVKKSRSSKPIDFGMLIWLSNIKDFWQANTALPFTRDATPDGEPITNAGEFCLLAFRAIEPDCPTSRVLNGMKTIIKQGGKSTGNLRA